MSRSTETICQQLRKPTDGWTGDASCVSADVAELAADILDDLISASQEVLDGLNARIDAADHSAVPVFNGIAALHDALYHAKKRRAAA